MFTIAFLVHIFDKTLWRWGQLLLVDSIRWCICCLWISCLWSVPGVFPKHLMIRSNALWSHICWKKLVNEPTMHVRRAQEDLHQTKFLCHTHSFCAYIIWYKWTHSHKYWSHLWNVQTNVIIFVTWLYKCHNNLWCEIIHS